MSLKDIKKTKESILKQYKHGIVNANANTLIHKIGFDSPQLTFQFSGFSYDRIHSCMGPESSGKSSLFTYIAGQLQKKMPIEIERLAKVYEESGDTDEAKRIRTDFADKFVVVYLDFEGTFDPSYASKLGLNCDDEHLILLQPDSIEEGFDMAEQLIKSGSICCVIFDSDATATTNLDNESSFGSTGFNGAKDAAVLAMVYKKYNVLARNYWTPMLVVSQERANMNVMSHLPSSTGGTAIKFYATTRNRVTKIDQIKQGNDNVGIQVRVRNYKNKAGIPWRDAVMNLYFDKGFDSEAEYFDFFVSFGLIHKSAGWYDAPDIGMPKINGGEKVKNWLKDNPEIYASLKEQVDKKLTVSNELDADNYDPTKNEVAEIAKEKGLDASKLAEEALAIQKEDNDFAEGNKEDSPDLGL